MKPIYIMVSLVLLTISGVAPAGAQECGHCETYYSQGDWHYFPQEQPPFQYFACTGEGCHMTHRWGDCSEHYECGGEDLDLDGLIASITSGIADGQFRWFLNRYEDNLFYDETLEAIQVTGCGGSLVAVIPLSPEAYGLLADG